MVKGLAFFGGIAIGLLVLETIFWLIFGSTLREWVKTKKNQKEEAE